MGVREGARRWGRRLTRSGASESMTERLDALERQVAGLEAHVQQLDEELLDARSQSRRAGEISDLVTQLLANEASRRDPEFQRIVTKFLDAT